MITINSTPAANRIILDGNNTLISLTSTNGAGYYFRALIFVDGILFDTQSWSRKDLFTADKNLKKFYNAYFEKVFSSSFISGVTEPTDLKKRINITIQELKMDDDTIIDVVSLPEFHILYNIKPFSFKDTEKVKILGVESEKILIPSNGKISIPFYANTASESITVSLKDNFGITLNSVTIPSGTEKKVFMYKYDLSESMPLVNNTIYFILTITVGSTSVIKSFRYIEFPDYEIKQIAYLNNFGFYLYAYLDGQMSIDDALSQETYQQLNGTDKIIEINEDYTYSINTGSLLSSEKAIIREIANAHDAKLYFNGEWFDMVNRTKKIKDFQDRLNNYSESLTFGVNRNPDIDNNWADDPGEESEVPGESETPESSTPPESSIPPESSEPPVDSEEPPTESRITLNNVVENTGVLDPNPDGQYCLDVDIYIADGYDPENVILILTEAGSIPVELLVAVNHPIHICSFLPGNYFMSVKEVETGLISNEIYFSIP